MGEFWKGTLLEGRAAGHYFIGVFFLGIGLSLLLHHARWPRRRPLLAGPAPGSSRCGARPSFFIAWLAAALVYLLASLTTYVSLSYMRGSASYHIVIFSAWLFPPVLWLCLPRSESDVASGYIAASFAFALLVTGMSLESHGMHQGEMESKAHLWTTRFGYAGAALQGAATLSLRVRGGAAVGDALHALSCACTALLGWVLLAAGVFVYRDILDAGADQSAEAWMGAIHSVNLSVCVAVLLVVALAGAGRALAGATPLGQRGAFPYHQVEMPSVADDDIVHG